MALYKAEKTKAVSIKINIFQFLPQLFFASIFSKFLPVLFIYLDLIYILAIVQMSTVRPKFVR